MRAKREFDGAGDEPHNKCGCFCASDSADPESLPTHFARAAVEKGRHEPSCRANLAGFGCEADKARVNLGCCQAIGEESKNSSDCFSSLLV